LPASLTDLTLSFLPYDLLALLAFSASWLLTGFVYQKLRARAIMDLPNERSMHKVPVPRGGGLAVVTVIGAGMVLFLLFTHAFSPALAQTPFALLLAALVLLMGVSWLDDKKGLRASIRLGAHLLAAGLGVWALGPKATLFGDALPLALDRTIMVFGWAWMINLTNFMDGIDGITSVQSTTTALGAGLCLWLVGLFFVGGQLPADDLALAALIAGACLGFLPHNWHPAKLFLGDVGSVPLGFLMGFLLLRLATQGHPTAALILPLYYLADSGLTLAHRAFRGEKFWLPHRTHFYQRAAAGEERHDLVTLWIFKTDLLLIMLACISLFYPLPALVAAVLLVALLLRKLHKSGKKVSS